MANNTIDRPHNPDLEKKYRPLVIVLSIVIPVVVAVLFGMPKVEGVDLSFLPPIYATINGITAVLLVMAVISVKKGNIKRHELLIKCAIACSLLFLVGYVAYHLTSDSTPFGGTGTTALIYYFLLISHIILSIGVLPLVLITYLKGWAGNLKAHRRLAKITFPLWLYVAVSGVIVYLMISPYYA